MNKISKYLLVWFLLLGIVGCKNTSQTTEDNLIYENEILKEIELMDFGDEGKKLNEYLNEEIIFNDPYHYIWIFENLRNNKSGITSNPNEEMLDNQSMLQINLSVESQKTVVEDELVEIAYLIKIDSKEFNKGYQLELRNNELSYDEIKENVIYTNDDFIIVNILNLLYPNYNLLEISEQKKGYKQTNLEGLNEIAILIIEEVVNFYAQ